MFTKIVISNFFFQSIGQFGARIISYAFFLFAANYLGTTEYGIFSLVMSIGYLVVPIMDFGLDQLIVMSISQNERNSFFSLANTKLTTVLCGFFIILIIVIFSNSTIRMPLFLFGVGICFQSLLNPMFGYFRGVEKMQWEAIGLLGQRILLVILGSYFVLEWRSAIAACSSFAISLILAFVFMYQITQRELNSSIFKPRLFLGKIKTDILKAAMPLAIVDLLWGIYYRIDTVIIAQFCSMEDNGIYNGAYKLIEGFMLIGSVIMISTFPRFAYHAKNNIQNFRREFKKICIFLLGLSICVVVFIYYFGNLLVQKLLGSQYIGSVDVLHVLSLSIIAIYPGYLISYCMIALKQKKKYMIGLFAGASANLLLNLILIPEYDITGAAWSKVISTFIICSVCGIFLFNYMRQTNTRKFA